MIGIVRSLSDRLLNALLPDTTATASDWTVASWQSCGCIDRRYYQKWCTAAGCGPCQRTGNLCPPA
ncbi:hypothetical protein [Phytomonospora endophytica]|uniref:Uncharacterized protein n=1 Tax=Phytomonospora endophytica TaxID=714109 RepID=A0A841G1E7_9ACTN|nr:hypothetical protein [Phytomonospora endophytica]MBB6039582.1 hypothetical protein [Phytomonospora endophytica]GIG70548.1 hypothetical protein Pen01_68430 [Phytomonospora endophytica]